MGILLNSNSQYLTILNSERLMPSIIDAYVLTILHSVIAYWRRFK